MDFEQQKPITDEYRKGWERIYAQQEARKEKKCICIRTLGHHAEFCPMRDESKCEFHKHLYSNGCPILSEEKNG